MNRLFGKARQIFDVFRRAKFKGCHGRPERCLTIGGRKMKICARCVGIKTGHWTAILLSFFQLLPPWWVSLLLIVPMAIDGGLQLVFRIYSNNPRRVITGLLGGFGIGSLIWGTLTWGMRVGIEAGLRWAVDYVGS